MNRLNKLSIFILIITIICCVCAEETDFAEDGEESQLRLGRKKTENVKKQKQQNDKESQAATRSQLTNSANFIDGTLNDQEQGQNTMQTMPSQIRHLNSPLNVGGIPNFAYPSYGYLPQAIHSFNYPSFLHGNPNIPMQPINSNFIRQQPLTDHLSEQGNLMGAYGTTQLGIMPSQLAHLPLKSLNENELKINSPFPQYLLTGFAEPSAPNNPLFFKNHLMASGQLMEFSHDGQLVQPPQLPQQLWPNRITEMGNFGTAPEILELHQNVGNPSQNLHLANEIISNQRLTIGSFGSPQRNEIVNGLNVAVPIIIPGFGRLQRSLKYKNEE